MALEGSGVPMTLSPPPFLLAFFLSKTWYGGGHDNPVSILCLTECDPPLILAMPLVPLVMKIRIKTQRKYKSKFEIVFI